MLIILKMLFGKNSKPVFYKMFLDKGTIYSIDLQFDVDNVRSWALKEKGH